MKDKMILTAESVTEGHPDKLCDLIADSVLDECLRSDPCSRVACEVLATAGKVIVAGEITTEKMPDIPYIVCRTIRHVGYGYRCIHAVILREAGGILSSHAVLQSMQRLRVQSKARVKKSYLAGVEHPQFSNVLDRRFRSTVPFQNSEELQKCYKTLNGAAQYRLSLERDLLFSVAMTSRGRAVVKGEYQERPDIQNILRFEIETDQTCFSSVIYMIERLKGIFGA